MSNLILTCNAGSNNTKLAVFDAATLARIDHTSVHSGAEAIKWLNGKDNVVAVAHRVVHGGLAFTQPKRITREVLDQLKAFIPLAPLHQPAAINLIEAAQSLYPDIPHIACFDTAFHHTVPDIRRRLPLPRMYHADGILRYGFHGLSYKHIADVLPDVAGPRAQGLIIVVHLGGGASACAMKNLQSIDTTMGFSTLDGLMMGTRPGAMDTGVLLHLLLEKKMSAQDLSDLLYYDAGLKGVSGISENMKDLLASSDPAAHEAVDLYCTLAAKQIAGLVSALGGLDAIVFTGGIGENAAPVRDKITALLRWIGDFAVYVIPTNEERVMAEACKAMHKNNDINKSIKERDKP